MSDLETLIQVLDSEVREVTNFHGSTYLTLKENGKDKKGRYETKAYLNGPLAMAKIAENSLIISVALNEEEYVVIVVHPRQINFSVIKNVEDVSGK
jgi:hypothetical protein